MARLEIEGERGDLQVKLDGRPVPDLRGLGFEAVMGCRHTVRFEIAVDEVSIDTEAFAWIKAKMAEQARGS